MGHRNYFELGAKGWPIGYCGVEVGVNGFCVNCSSKVNLRQEFFLFFHTLPL